MLFKILIISIMAFNPLLSFNLKGCLKIHSSDNQVPQLRVFFGGKETTTDREGMYTLPFAGEKAPERITMLVCQNILPHFDKSNTMSGYLIKDTEPYKCYVIQRTEKFGGWKHVQVKLSAKTHIDPAKTLVVLIDPGLVEAVEPWNLVASENTLAAPALRLKATQKPELTLASHRSLLSSLDMKPFHETVDHREEKKPKVKLALND